VSAPRSGLRPARPPWGSRKLGAARRFLESAPRPAAFASGPPRGSRKLGAARRFLESPATRLRIGLTGGIGSGKSAAAHRFAVLGAAIIDADVIAHQITAAGGSAMPALIEAFGHQICDANGALDRAAMRQRVFGDPQARARLESILHPRIGAVMREAACEQEGAYLVFVVPLLVEHLSRWRPQIDRLCVVDCPVDVQVARVQARSGLDVPTIHAILAAQATRAQRLAVADDVIDNSGDLQDLTRQVDALHAKYLRLANKN